MQNQIDAVLKMEQSTNQTKVRSFINAVTFYKSIWSRQSYVLAPLHKLTGVGRFIWGSRQEKAFLTMKAIIAVDSMSYYPDLNKFFDICTDANKYQMGVAIIQDGPPIACWSKKFTDSRQ